MEKKTFMNFTGVEISPTPVRSAWLEADSTRNAFYVVELLKLTNAGYIVRKSSGAEGAKASTESWYRDSISGAEKKMYKLINDKLRKKEGRIYHLVREVVITKQSGGNHDQYLYR